MKSHNIRLKQIALSLLIAGVATGPVAAVYAADGSAKSTVQSVQNDAKEGWREGMIEGAYLFNNNLSALDIDVEVDGSIAKLSGFVDTNAAKSLAEEIALSIDGVQVVENNLQVDAKKSKVAETTESLGAQVSDATITAKVKTKLLANSEVKGLGINVDTKNQEVTLTGKVGSDVEKELAYYIARNTDGVKSVKNSLQILERAS